MNLKCIFHDDRPRPDAVHQFVLGDKFPGRLNQYFNNLEGSPTDWHGRPKDSEFAASKVDLALA